MAVELDGVIKVSKENPFYGKWDSILDMVSLAFSLSAEEKKRVKATKMAQLIAAIPFIAGCEDAERTAISHIGTYILTVRTEKVFDHQPSDDKDLFRRLQMINNHIGGNKKLIKRGLNLIVLNMIQNYKNDAIKDKEAGKYNPISAGKWNYEKTRDKLLKQIKSVESPFMDEIVSPEEELQGWWLAE